MKKHQFSNARQKRLNTILYCFVTASFIIPIVYLLFRIFAGDTSPNEAGYHSDADYVLMLVQCLLGLAVINLPALLAKQFRFEIPLVLYALYLIFLYCAIFLGEVRSFYYVIPHWDSILHAFSSLMLGFFGFMVIAIMNRDEHIMVHLSPAFAAVFAFCFALTIGSLWEIYEFTFDGILGMNMQKFITAEGIVLTGHDALRDTMKDLMIDAIGAAVASFVGFFAIVRDKKWIYPKLTNQ